MSITRFYYARCADIMPVGMPPVYRAWFVRRDVLPDFHFRQWSPPGKRGHCVVRVRSRKGMLKAEARQLLDAMEADPRFATSNTRRLRPNATIEQMRSRAPAKVAALESIWGVTFPSAGTLRQVFRRMADASAERSTTGRIQGGPPEYSDDTGEE